jgi:hypothetical protein
MHLRRKRIRTATAFALPLVMFVSFFATAALAIMIERQSAARLAAARQIAGYQQHHMQAGLKQLQTAWSSLFKINDEKRQARGTIGYDIIVEGAFSGGRVEVRLKDAQGSLRRRTIDLDPFVCQVLDAAADAIAGGKDFDPNTLRDRGPGQVSLESASPEVLMALAGAVDPAASAAAFAEAVLKMRADKRLTASDLRSLTQTTGLGDDKLRLLEQCVVVEPTLWMMVATTRSVGGDPADRQGGLVVGAIRGSGVGSTPGTPGAPAAPTAPVGAASATSAGSANNWTILTWGPLSDAEIAKFEQLSTIKRR